MSNEHFRLVIEAFAAPNARANFRLHRYAIANLTGNLRAPQAPRCFSKRPAIS